MTNYMIHTYLHTWMIGRQDIQFLEITDIEKINSCHPKLLQIILFLFSSFIVSSPDSSEYWDGRSLPLLPHMH